MFKKRAQKGQKAKILRRDSESDSSDDDSSVKKRVKVAQDTKITNNTQTASSESKLTRNEKATEVDTLNQELIDQDRRMKEKTDKETVDDGNYKGQANYTKFITPKKEDRMGPKKASSNIRTTTIFDFARDICKDYKQTGFCGYGDSCKFLHARDDFKAGWKLNKDWDLKSKDDGEDAGKVKDIPFKCIICKKDYKSPVKTSCDHYFCESCFLNRNKKTPNCFICGKNTNGVALPAKDLKAKITT